MFKLLSKGNPKTLKGQAHGYMTYILHLSPSDVAGVGNTCPKATEGCRAACLNTAGRGGMFKPGGTNSIQEARKRKTHQFFQDRAGFMIDLAEDIKRAIKQAQRKGFTPVFRLNGTSDLSWEKYTVGSTGMNVFEMFPLVQFYDYTKVLGRKVAAYKNYHLTFSRAETNQADVDLALAQGMNVATVYDAIPEDVYSADEHDLRFLDPAVGVVGLKAKGRAKKDYSGFVIRLTQV